jgi:hypothetical protein
MDIWQDFEEFKNLFIFSFYLDEKTKETILKLLDTELFDLIEKLNLNEKNFI